MKQTIYLLLLCLVLSGCWQSYPVMQSANKMLNIPSPPSHRNEVHIFFPGEAPPQRPYLKIKMLSVSGDEYDSDDLLLGQLKSRAQAEGLDDILLVDKNFKSELVTEIHSPTMLAVIAQAMINPNEELEDEEVTVLYNTKEFTGVGIKYIDNMDYVRDIIKTENIFTYNPVSRNYELAAFVTFELTGQIEKKEDKDQLLQFLDDHLLDHLLYDEGGSWRYKNLRYDFTRRKLTVLGEIAKVCDVTFDETHHVKKIEIYIAGQKGTETIEYSYDKTKRMTGCVMRTKRFPYLREERIFNENGSWKEFHYYNENGTLLMKRSWVCFDKEDLKALAR